MESPAAVALRGEVKPEESDDARWVASARTGDSEAILRLLARHRPPLVRLLAGLMGDRGAAEDLAQEAFLQAFRQLGQLRDGSAFYPWVRRLAVRRAWHWLRRPREVVVAEIAAPDTAIDPARAAEERIALSAALARLPADLRAALVLREMEQLEYREIAELLGIPVGTVRSRLFTARERFRNLWREMEAEG